MNRVSVLISVDREAGLTESAKPLAEKKSPTSKPTSATTRRKATPLEGTLAALRRRTPRLLEPFVSRAACQPTLRRAYRRLTR